MVRKKILVILAVCLVAIVGMSLFTWSLMHPQIPQTYELNIARNVNNAEEETALAAAESINYTPITSLERFANSTDPQAYLSPSDYLSYVCANFIDSETINYYQTRYDNQQGKEYPRQIELNYQANATKYTEFRIYNSPAPQGVTWHNTTIVLSAPNGAVTFNSAGMQIYYRNQSSYQTTDWDYDFNFSDCYFVKMNLEYSETYAPLAAFFATIDQIVVLDKNFEPVLVGLDSGLAVA